jgi:hypothetical protein
MVAWDVTPRPDPFALTITSQGAIRRQQVAHVQRADTFASEGGASKLILFMKLMQQMFQKLLSD